MEELNEFIRKCADEIKSRGLCEEGDEARPAFLMIAITDSPAAENANITTVMGGDGKNLIAAIATLLDEDPILGSLFEAVVTIRQNEKMTTEVKCNTEC